MIKEVIKTIKNYLDGTFVETKGYPFYLELEHEILCLNYDEMYKENKEVTELLNQEIPDICASVGEITIEEFKRQLKIELDKVNNILNKTY